MTPEGKIQSSINKYLSSIGYIVVKNMAVSLNGWPDVSCYGPYGKTFMIEVKAKGGRLSRIQQYRIANLQGMGHQVFITDDLKTFKGELKTWEQQYTKEA